MWTSPGRWVIVRAMPNFLRVAIVDRSFLAHNVYATLLKPLGFSLFSFQTLKELKESFNPKWNTDFFLINSNAFAASKEKYLEWFQKEKNLRATPKVFICEAEKKGIWDELKKIPNSHFLMKPFYPPEFGEKVKTLCRWKND